MMRMRPLVMVIGLPMLMTLAANLRADDKLDFRGPLRLGIGWSGPFKSSEVTGSYQLQVRFLRLTPWMGLEGMYGLTFVGVPPLREAGPNAPLRGFTSLDLGAGLSFRSEKGGPLVVTSGTAGIIFDAPDDTIRVIGFGMALTTEVYPLYLDISEAIECEKGALYTYVGSGLFLWSSLRDDFFAGAAAPSWAAGIGIDLGRTLMLPPLGYAMQKGCSKKKYKAPPVDDD